MKSRNLSERGSCEKICHVLFRYVLSCMQMMLLFLLLEGQFTQLCFL